MSLDEILSDITPTDKPLKDKMKLPIKKYKCQRCSTIFTEEVNKKFIKTIMSECPKCHSTEVLLIKTIETKAKK